jgi:hypothetical protein
MALGILTIVVYCLINATPHFLYGPGEDALSLTIEHGGVKDDEQTKTIQEKNNKKLLCQRNGKGKILFLFVLLTKNFQFPKVMRFHVKAMKEISLHKFIFLEHSSLLAWVSR